MISVNITCVLGECCIRSRRISGRLVDLLELLVGLGGGELELGERLGRPHDQGYVHAGEALVAERERGQRVGVRVWVRVEVGVQVRV